MRDSRKLLVFKAGNDTMRYTLRPCWVRKDNLHVSAQSRAALSNNGNVPVWRAIVLESVWVHPDHRRKGLCKGLIEEICKDSEFDLAIVECVQNPCLRAALKRWGWKCDEVVWDFYHFREKT